MEKFRFGKWFQNPENPQNKWLFQIRSIILLFGSFYINDTRFYRSCSGVRIALISFYSVFCRETILGSALSEVSLHSRSKWEVGGNQPCWYSLPLFSGIKLQTFRADFFCFLNRVLQNLNLRPKFSRITMLIRGSVPNEMGRKPFDSTNFKISKRSGGFESLASNCYSIFLT